MVKNIFLILFTFASCCNAQSDLRVAIGLLTTEKDDPQCDSSFIAGYESIGGKWTGELTVLYSQNVKDLTHTDIAEKYDIVTFNSQPGNIYQYIENSSKGVQYVLPAGSNYFRYVYEYPILDPVICGSGYNENATGYPCEFWDRDPYGANDTILMMIQGGQEFGITGVNRLTDSTIGIHITGDDNNSYMFEHGTPIRITALRGTDINPLPEGLFYLTYGAANYLIIKFRTSTGTFRKIQVPGVGTFKYGSNDDYIFVRTSHWNPGGAGLRHFLFGYSLYNVTGFHINPNGVFELKNMSPDGFGDKMEFLHDLGDGTYTGGGKTNFSSQSYATPYIAGLIAFIKDSVSHRFNRECTWWEARYRARVTASGNGIADTTSGYGRIDVMKAINYDLAIPPNPYELLGDIGTLTARKTAPDKILVNFTPVDNAIYYVVYNNNDSLQLFSKQSGLTYAYYKIDKLNKDQTPLFWYKALRGSQETPASEKVSVLE